MNQAPKQVGEADVVAYLVLNDNYRRTKNTRHIVDGSVMKDFYGLCICRYQKDLGYYLYYCDSSWHALTDTYHNSMEEAMAQAELEYASSKNGWLFPDSNN
jgi:hypothetical protein